MIELNSISKKFKKQIFKDFSYKFEKNNIYYLSGRNGSGKTTLLKIIKGTYILDDGEIYLDCELNQRSDIAYIDGNSRTFFHRLTVRQNLEYFFSLQSPNKSINSVNQLLNFFKISDLENKLFSSLSQGQMQLVSIIRGLSMQSKVILLDEVFSSLDIKNKKIIFEFLSDFILKEEGLVIFTSHDKSLDEIKYKELCLR